jgi:hypothetical protein
LIETLRAEGGVTDGDEDGDCGEGLALYRWKESVTAAGIDGLHHVKVVIENAKTEKTIYELESLLFEAPDDVSTAGSARRDQGKRRRP